MEEILRKILSEVNGIKVQMDDMKSQMDDMKVQMEGMGSQLDENTGILRALEHKVDVNSSEISNISTDLAEIKGIQKKILEDIEDIKHDVNILAINTAKNSLDVAKLKGVIGK